MVDFPKGASTEWICACGETLYEIVPCTRVLDLGGGKYAFVDVNPKVPPKLAFKCITCGTYWNPSRPESRKLILETRASEMFPKEGSNGKS